MEGTKDNWVWYGALVQGMGDVLFEADATKMRSSDGSLTLPDHLIARRITLVRMEQTNQGLKWFYMKWGMMDHKELSDNVCILRKDAVITLGIASPDRMKQASNLWEPKTVEVPKLVLPR